jgi:hypothetical protein
MRRIIALPGAAVAVAALAVATTWGGLAVAAPGKAGHQAKPPAKTTPKAAPKADPPITFDSEFNGGQFVTLVSCSSTVTPPPVSVGVPGAPLTLHGTGPSAGAATLLTKPGGYKTVYVCTIIVKKRVTKKFHLRKVVISTGFGGEAGSVARHHPAG